MLLERPRSLSTDGHCAIAFPFPPAKRFVPLHHASTGTGAGPNGGGWSFFVCPACGRRARVLNHDKYAVDARGLGYSYAYIALKRLGVGQYYLINIKDKDGEAYDGAKTYRLHVPPNVPVEQYWSVTAYDRETHALIKGVDRVSRASNAADLEKNADGSVERVVRAEGAGRQADELGPDRSRPPLRTDVPALRPDQGFVRQGLDAAERGEGGFLARVIHRGLAGVA